MRKSAQTTRVDQDLATCSFYGTPQKQPVELLEHELAPNSNMGQWRQQGYLRHRTANPIPPTGRIGTSALRDTSKTVLRVRSVHV
jgi:hypothetical protein